jgi:uncharacterized protein DUF3306
MSGPDQSDHDKQEDKGFLARWSQRKQEAKRSEQDAPVAKSDVPSDPLLAADAQPEFDLSSLPKLEEITATTDISAFLRKGVPEQLRNAALRKSWALDPAIRNYVSPALDYAYDWNTPGGVPGSSEIGAGVDVARMVSQIMGSGELASEPTVVETSTQVTNDRTDVQQGAQSPTLPEQSQRLSANTVPLGEPGDQVAKIEDSEGTDRVASQQPMRRHGSAKPSA